MCLPLAYILFLAAVLLCVLHQSLAHLSNDSECGGAEFHSVSFRDLHCMPSCGKGKTGTATSRSRYFHSFIDSRY